MATQDRTLLLLTVTQLVTHTVDRRLQDKVLLQQLILSLPQLIELRAVTIQALLESTEPRLKVLLLLLLRLDPGVKPLRLFPGLAFKSIPL